MMSRRYFFFFFLNLYCNQPPGVSQDLLISVLVRSHAVHPYIYSMSFTKHRCPFTLIDKPHNSSPVNSLSLTVHCGEYMPSMLHCTLGLTQMIPERIDIQASLGNLTGSSERQGSRVVSGLLCLLAVSVNQISWGGKWPGNEASPRTIMSAVYCISPNLHHRAYGS